MDKQVDQYLLDVPKWSEQITLLREIILDCQLNETFKWKTPCYTYNNKNILLINSLKNYCAIGFFKGVLLRDTENILFSQGENSRSVRLLKFTSLDQIKNLKSIIEQYIFEAIEIEHGGLKVEKSNDKINFSEELLNILDENSDLKIAFHALTPGRQKGYHLHFSSAKQAKTRISRIQKQIPKILKGYGFHDCSCGLSKRMPTCDGSHKYI